MDIVRKGHGAASLEELVTELDNEIFFSTISGDDPMIPGPSVVVPPLIALHNIRLIRAEQPKRKSLRT